MKKNELILRYRDICARLPYGLVCEGEYMEDGTWETRGISHWEKVVGPIQQIYNLDEELSETYIVIEGQSCDLASVKPYLRRMESLSKEEQTQMGRLDGTAAYRMIKSGFEELGEFLKFCYEKHVDIYGLIDKGLAIEVTEENDPYKEDSSVNEITNYECEYCNTCQLFDGYDLCVHKNNFGAITDKTIENCKENKYYKEK